MAKKKRKAPAPVKAPAKREPAPVRDRFLWPILLLALVLRLLFLKASQASPFYEPTLLDAKYYHDWALRISHGDFGQDVFYGLPLYPFFLGCVYRLFNDSLLAAKLVQILLGLGTVYFVYRIAEKIADETTAVFSALLAACYGPLIFHEGIFIPEALGVPLYAAAFLWTLRFLDRPQMKAALKLGVLYGLCMLTKAGIFPFVLIMCGSLLFSKKAANAKPALACLAAFFVTLAPVTAHNVAHGKDLVWLSSHAGFNFYIGNNEKAEGVFAAPEGTGTNVDAQIQDSKAVAEKAMGKSLKPSEVSKYWSDKAWAFIRENPVKFLVLCGRKFVMFFDAREISDIEDYQFAAMFNPFLRVPWPNFAVVGPLFFIGLIVGYKKLKRRRTLLAWVGGYIAGMLLFFVNARYRLPMLPAMLPVAGFGAVQFYQDFVEWRAKRLAVYAAVLGAAVCLTQMRLVGTNFASDYVNAGDAWLEKNQAARALPLYEKAIEIDPASSKALLAKALALTKLGKHQEAKEFYEKTLKLDPDNAQAHNNLGLCFDREGNKRGAESEFLLALRLKPNFPQAHNNLGMLYGNSGKKYQAISEFQKAIELNPLNPRSYTNLGLVYYQMGDRKKALDLWEKALSIDPQFPDALRAVELLKTS